MFTKEDKDMAKCNEKIIMIKRLMCIIFASITLMGSVHFDVDVVFKRGKFPHDKKLSIVLNGQQLLCHCGQNAISLMFCYGVPFGYCEKHFSKLQNEDLQLENALAKGQTEECNLNGAHNG